jgi:hypothetical protein
VNNDGILDILVASRDYLYVLTGTTETSDATPPQITVFSPKKMTYLKNATGVFFDLTFSINEPVSWIGYALDRQANVTITGNTTMSGLSEGTHSLVVYAKDIFGNTGASEIVDFVVDTIPPSISILSLENETYTTNDIQLNVAVNEPVSWMGYTLDEKANLTMTGNTTLNGLFEGSHNLTVYATDMHENTGTSETIYFTIAQKTEPQQEPFPITWIVAAIVIIAIGAAVIFGVAVFRRKRSASSKTP